MEPTDRQRLNRFGVSAFISLLILMCGFWLYPIWLKSRPERTAIAIEQTSIKPHENIDVMVQDIFTKSGMTTPLASKVEGGITTAIYINSRPIEKANLLMAQLSDNQIESYSLNIDGIDAELRIFNGPALTHRILFTPSIDTSKPKKNKSKNIRDRPLVSVIVSGLGERDMYNVSRFKLPLTLAIQPYKPFSLRLAQDAGIHHHEVMIDMRDETVDLDDSLTSLPFASGLLTTKQYPSDLIPDFFTNAFPSEGVLSNRPHVLPTQIKGNHGTSKLLARALQIASQQGFVSIMIEANDPDIEVILNWMHEAKDLGYRLVFASEASRQVDVKGPLE